MRQRGTDEFTRFGGLHSFPPRDRWDDWVEPDPRDPRSRKRHYRLVPTVCFNCEAACGLLAYVDKETGEIRKLEGNPLHPASRGKNCAKGPATLAQVQNPDRILYPLRRIGPRGGGQWERVTWEEALRDIASRIRRALEEGRRDAVVYHVGRPGEDLFTERVLMAWGVDGHNSHTNVCSAGARAGYAFWMGMDRPAPDHANSRFILMLSAHLESGHYFNPHAQRIIEAKTRGAKIAVIDTRLSNTAAHADYWLAPWPGTEAAILLAMARHLIERDLLNHTFLRHWVNWEELLGNQDYLCFLKDRAWLQRVPEEVTYEAFVDLLRDLYRDFTPEWAASESGVDPATIIAVAEEIGRAGTAFASHIWRNAAAGNRGGWMVARCLFLLNVLVGALGTPGGTLPNYWCKFVPKPPTVPDPIRVWNTLHFPPEYPLAHFEMSFLLPYLLRDRRKRIEVYFTRVYNPVWTNPDGFAWIDMLTNEASIGLHVCLTPVWSETAQYADYVLPMGMGPERHDLHSYETHPAQWIGFRQPVQRVSRESEGHPIGFTYEANPGEVWEENEFWIELSWRIDPDGELGIRRHFEKPGEGRKITVGEYYQYIFEHSVPGLPEAAAKEGLSPLEYMRRYGAFQITGEVYMEHERVIPQELLERAEVDERGFIWVSSPPPKVNYRPYPGPFTDGKGRVRIGLMVDGKPVQGFPTPSGKLEFFSTTLAEWGWPEYAIPVYPRTPEERGRMVHITSQVHPSEIDGAKQEFVLIPTFRLPTLIHTRTNGAKWLYEISHINPVWIHPRDAARVGVQTGDLVRVETEIGYFVDRAWVTEAIRPGVVACSHHLGRWRLFEDHGSDRWNSAVVRLARQNGKWHMRQVHGVRPFPSSDPDSSRIWWTEGGVNQNLTFPVQPDPISGQHCWHQKVKVVKAGPGDRYGDVVVDAEKADSVYRRWLLLTRPGPGPGGLRRPYWLLRPLKPHPEAYRVEGYTPPTS
ncbi:MAG: molybdopterin-dependent oxidoreductase [Armatimonadota bacterium]|nr:molybdopterin-dependent oxidoreductase [Armatimonadota bacterium]